MTDERDDQSTDESGDVSISQPPITKSSTSSTSIPSRRADDAPAWAKELGGKIDRLMESQQAPKDDSDDGILSIEELPDLEDAKDAVSDAVESGKEAIEHIPERVPFLFRSWFGKDSQK